MHPRFDLLARFGKDERGVFGVIFAVLAIVLVAFSGAVVDFTYMETARSRAQTALDAAALALQATMSNPGVTADTLKSSAQALLVERLGDASIGATIDSATPNINSNTLNLQATIVVPTAFVQLVGIRTITSHMQSEATQGSSNLEVSIALDNTLSMAGTKIANLQSATKTLIGLLVKDQQVPTYSKMALVPYSYGVNVGADPTYYATKARGPVTDPDGKKISGAVWSAGNGHTIKGVTKANPAVVTVDSVSGLSNNDWIYITGVKGMTTLNGNAYQITSVNTTSNTFQLSGVNSRNYGSYTSSGATTECLLANCDVKITSTANGFADGKVVRVTGVGGLTGLNDKSYTIKQNDANTLTLLGSLAGGGGTYTSNTGTLFCTDYTCPYYYFTSVAGSTNTFAVSNCVTERSGSHAYDDTATGPGAYAGFMYPSTPTNCVAQQIVPLTSDKDALTKVAGKMTAAGSTAGHIGLAWAWYMLAPNFSTVWPGKSGAAYDSANLIKAVILMTDGQFNTQYYNGVISKDSQAIDGNSNMINHATTNTDELGKPLGSEDQAKKLCTAIKASGGPNHNTILYTVGFDISSKSSTDAAARDFLDKCATDDAHFYLAVSDDDGTSLTNAFKSIAKNLADLRLSK